MMNEQNKASDISNLAQAVAVPASADLDSLQRQMESQASAWFAVCAALDKAAPGWIEKPSTGKECAVAAIEEMAAAAQEHATQLAGQGGEQDEGLAQAIDERDTAEGWADGLAWLIAAYFGQDIGEHSSAHNPWQEAKDIIEEAEPYRSAAAAPIQAQEDARDASRFLSETDYDDLSRFDGMASDGEGYDISKERMKRLAELGVVRWLGRDRYGVTAFGQYVLKAWSELPLETYAETNARCDAEFKARIERLNAEAINAANGITHPTGD